MTALERANTTRLGMSAVKAEIASGELSIADAVLDPRAQPMTLFSLLMARRRWARTRTLRLLNRLGLRESKRLRELTDRQRELFLEALRR